MKDKRNLHLELQEMCDCYTNNDPLQEMSKLQNSDPDTQSAAVKWLAMAVLHGVTANAEKITIRTSDEGQVAVTAQYRPTDLPAPDSATAQQVIQALREITHIDADKGKLPLSLGVRDSNVDLEIKIKRKNGQEKVRITF